MFNPARWRAEKPAKIEAFFEFHFEATEVPKLEWEAMVVSLVPADAARPTARTGIAAVVNGVCSWEKPIYETVKLTQDLKTGKINDRVYRILVSAAISTKSRVLGEIRVNLADYTEAFKPCSVTLPLKGSNTGAILLVTLRRMQGGVEGRDVDGKRDVAVIKQRRTLQSRFSNCNDGEGGNVLNGANDINPTEIGPLIVNWQAQTFPSSRRVYFRANSNDNLRKSSNFGAISASSSDASPGQFTLEEDGITNNNAYQDSASLLSPICNIDNPRKPMTSSSESITNSNWSIGSASIGSMDESTNRIGETGSREMLQESDESPDKLIGDVALKRQLQVLELELHTLRKQVGKESRRGQDLLKELSGLKEERDLLSRECEKLKDSQTRKNGAENVSNSFQFDGEDPWSMIEKFKEELNHEKNLSARLCLELQKTQEANSVLILAVRNLEELLEQKNREACCVSCNIMPVKPNTSRDVKEDEDNNRLSCLPYPKSKEERFETTSENEEQYALDILVKEPYGVDVAYALDQKIIDLNGMVDLHNKDREDMEMQMEQLALDYEILQQENHYISSKLEQSQMREQLLTQYECSAHLAIINDLEGHVENLERELQKHIEAFQTDLEIITTAKVEQEKRAIQSEEALRKTRLNNANTVERLREEFKTIYVQMSSTCYANGKLLMQALEESSELRLQKGQLEELLEKTNGELGSVKCRYNVNFQQLLSLIEFKTEEADRLFLELKDKRKELEKQKSSSEELILLQAEMEKLLAEKHYLSNRIEHNEKLITEMEEMKRQIEESDSSQQERNTEHNFLQIELAAFREEANKSVVELNYLKHVMDEQEIMVRNLNSDLTTLRVQHLNLKDNLLEDELEKENLKQLVLNLTGDLQKKENTEITDLDESKNTCTRNKGNKSGIGPQSSMEVASLYDKIQLLKGEIKMKDEHMERDSL